MMVDAREAQAHITVFLDAIIEDGMSLNLILEWHRRLLDGTKYDIAGRPRHYDVGVGQNMFVPSCMAKQAR